MSAKAVLIIDDDAEILEALRELLEMEDYAVAVASNGQEALELLEAEATPPGLILMDLMMPVMDGETFVKALRRTDKHGQIPVIVLTASGTERPEIEALVQGKVLKPFELERLLEEVGKYFRE